MSYTMIIFTAMHAPYEFAGAPMGLLNSSKKNPLEKHTIFIAHTCTLTSE